MLTCKSGEWWRTAPYRARANNTVLLPRNEVTYEEFITIFNICKDSRAGEPGFMWTNNLEYGTNPCAEIGLRPYQFCNLTTVSQTNLEGKKDFLSRINSAAFLGTLQASYTDFPYIRPIWKETTESEALLGVSFTGIADAGNKVSAEWLQEGAQMVLETNSKTAKKIGINSAARNTCLKPEGSGSCVLGSSSGTSDRHDEYYIRRIRNNKDDSLTKYLEIVVPELLEDDKFAPNTVVLSIPQQAPEGAILRNHSTALSMFERVTNYYSNWIVPGHRFGDNTHNVSCTINVRDDEWASLGERMWMDRDKYTAISLFPYDTGTYIQAPFESCTKEKFEELSSIIKEVDLRDVFEQYDNTNRMHQLACAGGQCEIS
jgi:ribonucleoside-diphosphate reductase alpha chain